MTPVELERFLAKIEHEPMSGCWIWIGATIPGGYGQFKLRGWRHMKLAHRVSYEHFRGPIPSGLQLDHRCRIRCCVNPEHLEAVTCATNIRRGLTGENERRKTHCPSGHPYSGDNLLVARKNGRTKRVCRQCRREADARQYRTHHAKIRFRQTARRRRLGILPRPVATHCKRGHEFTPENTGRFRSGGRYCRACKRQWDREHRSSA